MIMANIREIESTQEQKVFKKNPAKTSILFLKKWGDRLTTADKPTSDRNFMLLIFGGLTFAMGTCIAVAQEYYKLAVISGGLTAASSLLFTRTVRRDRQEIRKNSKQ
jgi:hypothetical protein